MLRAGVQQICAPLTVRIGLSMRAGGEDVLTHVRNHGRTSDSETDHNKGQEDTRKHQACSPCWEDAKQTTVVACRSRTASTLVSPTTAPSASSSSTTRMERAEGASSVGVKVTVTAPSASTASAPRWPVQTLTLKGLAIAVLDLHRRSRPTGCLC